MRSAERSRRRWCWRQARSITPSESGWSSSIRPLAMVVVVKGRPWRSITCNSSDGPERGGGAAAREGRAERALTGGAGTGPGTAWRLGRQSGGRSPAVIGARKVCRVFFLFFLVGGGGFLGFSAPHIYSAETISCTPD